MTTMVCELGPAAVRRLDCGTMTSAEADPILGAAALEGGDGRAVLVGGEARPLPEVWRAALRPLIDGADRTVLIHPSWWPLTQIDTVRDVVSAPTTVEMITRAGLLAHRHGAGGTVVEIAEHVVAVVGGIAPMAVHARTAAPEAVAHQVAAAVLSRPDGRPVIVDAPAGVPGAEALASLIIGTLTAQRVRAWVAVETQFISAATLFTSAVDIPTPRAGSVDVAGRRRAVGALGIAAVVLAAGTSAVVDIKHRPTDLPDPSAGLAVSALLDGRVSMDVPTGWTVQRVVDGPGSARVQVMSPAEGEAMLHLTQSWTPDADLAAAATALRQGVDSETAGIFVDFNPHDTRAGRAAVTYREVRPGREIRWVVLVDEGVRISVGCQNAYGRTASVAAACDGAVRSARRVR